MDVLFFNQAKVNNILKDIVNKIKTENEYYGVLNITIKEHMLINRALKQQSPHYYCISVGNRFFVTKR